MELLQVSPIPKQTRPLLKQTAVSEALNKLQSLYVITPIDKASKNIAFICKRFYIGCLLEELGIPGNSSSTYSISSNSKDSIISNNESLCKKLLGKALSDKERDIPIIYWMP